MEIPSAIRVLRIYLVAGKVRKSGCMHIGCAKRIGRKRHGFPISNIKQNIESKITRLNSLFFLRNFQIVD